MVILYRAGYYWCKLGSVSPLLSAGYMNNNYRLGLWLLLWLLVGAGPARAQSDVRRAIELNRLYKLAKRQDAAVKLTADQGDTLAATCRRFFTVLSSDGSLPSAEDLASESTPTAYEEYADNALVGNCAQQLFALWIKGSVARSGNAGGVMKASRVIHRYNNTLAYIHYEARNLLTQAFSLTSPQPAWSGALQAMQVAVPATLPSGTDALALILHHCDSLISRARGPRADSMALWAALGKLRDWAKPTTPQTAPGTYSAAWQALQDSAAGPHLGKKKYDWAQKAVADAVRNEARAFSPSTGRVPIGLFSFAGTKYGPNTADLMGHPPTPAAGPPAGWETAVLDGTARFVAKRFREELSAAFMQQFAALFSERQAATYGANLQLLFPATKELLTSGSAAFSGALVQPLRAAVQRDLQTVFFQYGPLLLANAVPPDVLIQRANDTRTALRKRAPVLKAAINELGRRDAVRAEMERELTSLLRTYAAAFRDSVRLCTDIARLKKAYLATEDARRYAYLTALCLRHLAAGQHPAELLTQLPEELKNQKVAQLLGPAYVATTLLPALATLASLSDAFTDASSLRRAWVNEKQLTALLQDPQQVVLFQGLVLHRLLAVAPAGLRPVLWQVQQGRGVKEFQALVFGFAGLAARFEAQVQQLNGTPAPDKAPADSAARAGRARALLDLYQTTLATVAFAAKQVNHAPDSALARLETLQAVGELVVQGYAAAQQRQFGLALTSLVQVVEKTIPADYVNASLNWPQVVRYGSVMAAVGQARTPDEVQGALQAGALPSGSARVKRESLFTASLNTYAGLTAGAEYVQGSGLSGNLGFTAAIGPCLTWGVHRKPGTGRRATGRYAQAWPFGKAGAPQRREMVGAAWGVFVSVIDLGAPVLLHLGNGDAYGTVPENVDFRHVFAPGLMVAYNIRNSPLTVLAGGQFTANLRQRPNDNDRRNSTRYNVSLAFDIPLVHFGVRTEARDN